MSDVAEMQETNIVQEQQPTIADLAAFAFNKPPTQQAAAAETTTTTQAAPDTTTQLSSAETTTQAATTAPDYNAYLKEHFGVDDLGTAKAEWQTLQELKAKPPTAAEIAFANEESKKIHTLLKEGKTKEVRAYLEAQELLTNVETMDADKQLKLFIKMQNPLFDQELIDYQFDKDYKFDDSAFKDEDGNVTDQLGLRFAKAAAQQKQQNDLAKAAEFFKTYKQKIELPDISTQATQDEGYEAYKASTASATESYNNVVAPGIKALKETDIPLKVSLNDVNNKMQFEVNIVPDQADFEAARQDSLSVMNFLSKTCYDKDGKFIPQNLQRLVLLNNNFDKYGQAIARQAVNAERKRVLEQETTGGGMQRNFNTHVEPTELDALRQFAFPKTG
jgi:hypothetical protein